LSHNFPILSSLKQGDALPILLINFALDYTRRIVQGNHMVLKLNWSHQLLAYAEDMNLFVDNIDPTNAVKIVT
jgi:hypothetical protein